MNFAFTTDECDFDHADADRIGVLLINLGTPDACTRAAVRRYLREFLSDPRVVEMPRALWWPILHGFILTTRPRKTAAAYAKVWRADGSPLLTIARRQERKLRDEFAREFGVSTVNMTDATNAANATNATHTTSAVQVELAMRYGNPSVGAALAKLRRAGARKLLVLPLYPQYCAATTASAFDAVAAELARWRRVPAMRFIANYHDRRGYIEALAASVRDHRRVHNDDGDAVLVMSFHGIPQQCFDAGDPYHCECHKTARLLAEELELSEREWRIGFQSRFGPKRWLRPYTDEVLAELARDGARAVQVICPGFSADCLETLEEIALRSREVFLCAGGERFACIPCLNDRDDHIAALHDLIADNIRDWLEADRATDHATDRATRKQRAMAMGARA
ncbi:MAG: ferrochelatase [bacterium]